MPEFGRGDALGGRVAGHDEGEAERGGGLVAVADVVLRGSPARPGRNHLEGDETLLLAVPGRVTEQFPLEAALVRLRQPARSWSA